MVHYLKIAIGVIALTILFLVSDSGAIPSEQWNKTFGGPENDGAAFIQYTLDGGYLIGGYTLSFESGNTDAWLIKVDINGNMQWNKTFGGPNEDEVYSIQQSSDDGYIMVGRTEHSVLNNNLWIISIDEKGNMLWDNSIGGKSDDWAFSTYSTSDGGQAIAGVTTSFGAGSSDVWLIKIDKDGHEQWNKTFGGTNWDEGDSVQQTSEGGYILTGITEAETNPPYQILIGGDAWLIKTDAGGNQQWSKKFGGRNMDWTISIQQTTDGGYVLTGGTNTYGAGGADIWLIKTDEMGKEQWSRTFGGKGYDFGIYVKQTSDSGYIIVGVTESYGAGDSDVWIIKTDFNGVQQWNKTFGGRSYDGGSDVHQTPDGGYLIAGTTESYGAGGSDVWLIKLSSEVKLTSTPVPISTTTPSESTHTPIAAKDTPGTPGFEALFVITGILIIVSQL